MEPSYLNRLPEPFSWDSALAMQLIFFLGGVAAFLAGALAAGPAAVAFAGGSAAVSAWIVPAAGASLVLTLAALVYAARRSEYDLPIARALIAWVVLGLVLAVGGSLPLVLPLAVPWGLAMGLVMRPPQPRAWIARALVLMVAAFVLQFFALVLAPLLVRTGDELLEQVT